MPASRSVVSVLLRALGDVSLHPQGRPCGPAAPRRSPGHRTCPVDPDPQLDSIRRTFDAATDRLYRAKTMQEAEDELSNVLHQLYRLGELCRWRLSQPPGTKLGENEFHKILTSSDELRIARAAMWARTFNTHDVLMLATTYDPFGRWMPFLYGTAFASPTEPDKYGRDADYAKFLEGQLVVDATRRAFAALAALL